MQVGEFRSWHVDDRADRWDRSDFYADAFGRRGAGWPSRPEPACEPQASGWGTACPSWAIPSGDRHWLPLHRGPGDATSDWGARDHGSRWNAAPDTGTGWKRSGRQDHCRAHRAICDTILESAGRGAGSCADLTALLRNGSGSSIYIRMDGEPVRVIADRNDSPGRPGTPAARPETPPADDPVADPVNEAPVDPAPMPAGAVTALGGRATIRAADSLSAQEAADAIERARRALEEAYAASPTFRNAIDNARVGLDGTTGPQETFDVVVGRGPYAFPGMEAPIDGSFASLENPSGEEFVYIDLNQADIVDRDLRGRTGFAQDGLDRILRHEFGHAAANLDDGTIGEVGPNQIFSAQTSFELGDNPTQVAYTYGTALG